MLLKSNSDHICCALFLLPVFSRSSAAPSHPTSKGCVGGVGREEERPEEK